MQLFPVSMASNQRIRHCMATPILHHTGHTNWKDGHAVHQECSEKLVKLTLDVSGAASAVHAFSQGVHEQEVAQGLIDSGRHRVFASTPGSTWRLRLGASLDNKVIWEQTASDEEEQHFSISL